MNTDCVNGYRFGCTCRECWPGYAEVRPYNFPQEWIDRESKEQAKRDAEQFTKLQALMQQPSVFEEQKPPALIYEVKWCKEHAGEKFCCPRPFGLEDATRFARGLVENGFAVHAEVVGIYASFSKNGDKVTAL